MLVAESCSGKAELQAVQVPPSDAEDGASGSGAAGTPSDAQGDSIPPARPPSCASGKLGAGDNCGLTSDDDCCATLRVPGGSYLRFYDGVRNGSKDFPAVVSPFWLDKYEVTVGRFRAFVDAYPASKPKPGDGAHPKVPGTGWQAGWPMASDAASLRKGVVDTQQCEEGPPMWTDAPGANERRPINCLTWYELAAFCAWDGARLPSAAEWGFAAQAGSEQRYYPWSQPPQSTEVDPTRAVYSPDPHKQKLPSPEDVGSRPLGRGKWGHLDLAGNVFDMALDQGYSPDKTCTDCVLLRPDLPDNGRVMFGGDYSAGPNGLEVATLYGRSASLRWATDGGRCARDGK
jgi:formylglycine-generating enzyme required for sulfatase activity